MRKEEEEGQGRSCPQEIRVHPIHFICQTPHMYSICGCIQDTISRLSVGTGSKTHTHTFPHTITLKDSVQRGELAVLPAEAVENRPD